MSGVRDIFSLCSLSLSLSLLCVSVVVILSSTIFFFTLIMPPKGDEKWTHYIAAIAKSPALTEDLRDGNVSAQVTASLSSSLARTTLPELATRMRNVLERSGGTTLTPEVAHLACKRLVSDPATRADMEAFVEARVKQLLTGEKAEEEKAKKKKEEPKEGTEKKKKKGGKKRKAEPEEGEKKATKKKAAKKQAKASPQQDE